MAAGARNRHGAASLEPPSPPGAPVGGKQRYCGGDGAGRDDCCNPVRDASAIHAHGDLLGSVLAAYVATHGRQPSPTTIIKLRQQAALATRDDKTVNSLAELTARWHTQASELLGQDATRWATRLVTSHRDQRALSADDVPADLVDRLGRSVVEAVSEKRATWRHWNLHAEASRQLIGLRFATTADRDAILGLVVDAAEAASLQLTPPDLASTPAALRRSDGSSQLRARHTTVFTSVELLAAEDRLLQFAETTTAPAATVDEHQHPALRAIATSGRAVDLLVGPAGAGKTTALRALRNAWEAQHGPGSVIGLAPSAAAARVLADELGIATDTTAKWIYDRNTASAGQLLVVDEASLAGTLALDRIATQAAQSGAKLLLVGDWAQLAAVDAGGAFALLASARDDTPWLPPCTASANPGKPLHPCSCAAATPPSSTPTRSTAGYAPATTTKCSTPPTAPGTPTSLQAGPA